MATSPSNEEKANQIVGFGVALVQLVSDVTPEAIGETTKQQLSEFLSGEVAGPIANANSNLTAKIGSTDASVLSGETLGRAAYDLYEKTLEAAANNPVYRSVRTLLDDGLAIVKRAGETIGIVPGAALNPFNDPAFDPDAGATPVSEIADGGSKSYTVFLPYAAGEGGQRIRLNLNGTDTGNLRVIANGQELSVTNGQFDLTISEGARALTFALLSNSSVAEDANLTLTATLTDAEGNATHLTHDELDHNA